MPCSVQPISGIGKRGFRFRSSDMPNFTRSPESKQKQSASLAATWARRKTEALAKVRAAPAKIIDGKEVLTRDQARELGLKKYFSGESCRKGHLAHRFTSNNACEVCGREGAARWHRQNKERVKVYDAERYAADIENRRAKARQSHAANREQRNTQSRRFHAENPDWQKKWNASNRERVSAATRKWQIANPEKARAIRQSRHARLRGAPGKTSTEEIVRLLHTQQFKCATCSADIEAPSSRHLDHKTPVCRGGGNEISNLQWLCRPCNRRKYKMTQEEWLERWNHEQSYLVERASESG